MGDFREKKLRQAGLSLLALLAISVGACDRTDDGPTLHVETIELQYLRADDAMAIIDPYVYGDRDVNPGYVSLAEGVITIRETADNLAKIRRVLEEFDKPKPGVTLHFQIIEADGPGGGDPGISDVENELRKIFQYEGYRLVGEGLVRGMEGRYVSHRIATSEGIYVIEASLNRVRPGPDGGVIQMEVQLSIPGLGTALETGVTVAVDAGQTVVIGTARPDPNRGAIILAVKPSFDSAE